MKSIDLRSLVGTALCVALELIIPMLFHAIGLGATFSPMHLPVLICGLCFGPWYGLICGVLGPFISSIVTGMPPLFPTCLTMTFELSAYGFFSGLFYRSFKMNLYLSLIITMIIGRIVGGLVSAIIFTLIGSPYSFELFFSAYFITTIPGILVQIILVPLIVIALEKGRVITKPQIDSV